MAHKKGAGSSRNGRDSNGQRLGIKVYEGETVDSGAILLRQRGNKFKPGRNTARGRDFTIYSVASGVVLYEGGGKVSVIPPTAAAAKPAPGK